MEGGQRYQWALKDPMGLDERQRYTCGEYYLDMAFLDDLGLQHHTVGYDGFFGLILAFDVTSQPSWTHVTRMYSIIAESFSQDGGAIPFDIVILGLKADVPADGRCVDGEVVNDFATSHALVAFECSAKTGEGVEEPFDFLVQQAYRAAITVGSVRQWQAKNTDVCRGVSNAMIRLRQALVSAGHSPSPS